MKSIRNIVVAVVILASTLCNADTYDPTTNKLIVSSVTVGDTTYTDVVITVGSIISVGGSSTASATANYAGTWVANYGGYSITATATQTGNALSFALSSPILAPGQVYAGEITENTVNTTKNDYTGSAAATLTILSSTSISATQTSCSSTAGYQCVIPNGVPLAFTKQ